MSKQVGHHQVTSRSLTFPSDSVFWRPIKSDRQVLRNKLFNLKLIKHQVPPGDFMRTQSPPGGTWRHFHGKMSIESKDTKSPRWDLMSESKCKLMRNETTATRSSSYTNNSNSNNKANRIPFSLKNVSVIFVEWARPVVTVAELMLMNVSTHFSLPYGPFRRSTAQVSGRRSAPFI